METRDQRKEHSMGVKLIMNMSGKPREVSLNMSTTTLGAEDGADKLIKELDKIYCKDSTQSLFKAIDQFESYRRTPDEDIDKYILEFQRKYKALKQLQENKDLYGDAILAYRLLNKATKRKKSTKEKKKLYYCRLFILFMRFNVCVL